MEGLSEGAVLQDSLISWVPTYDQAGRYTVVIKANDGRGGQVERRFTLEVSEAALPDLSLSLIDFGDVAAGQVVERTYALHNPTNLTMEITPPVTIDGPFVTFSPDQALSLAPGATIEGTVRFTAPDRQSAQQQATLTLQTNLGPVSIPVAGASLWHHLVLDRALIDFGSVPIGGHTSQHIEIHNQGTMPLTLEVRPDDTQFATIPLFVATPARFELAAGASRWLRITYVPRRPTREAALVGFFSSDVLVKTLPIQGMGVEPPVGFVHLDFNLGEQDQGQRSFGSLKPGDVVTAQLVIQRAPDIVGWTARIAYNPFHLSYVAGSFVPGDFIPDLSGLVDAEQGGVEVGGQVLRGPGSQPSFGTGSGVLGAVSFRVEPGFTDETDLTVNQVRLRLLHRPAVHTQTTIVRSTALLSATSIDGVNPELPSDFNGDGTVAFDDFFAFADVFNLSASEPGAARFDLTADGQIDFDDFFVFADAFGQSVAGKLVVASTPTSFALEPNYPNPFNAETLLSYRLSTSGPVQLAIYTVNGQQVEMLVAADQPAGHYTISWDGRNAMGRAAASGVYLAVLQAGQGRKVRKLMLIR
jgi:hypothetical protein